MIFTKEQRQEAYRRLSPEAQTFVMSNEVSELIDNLLKKTGLAKEQIAFADGEIFLVMLSLQTLSDAIFNIAKLSNRDMGNFLKLKSELDEKIFSKIPRRPQKETGAREPQKKTVSPTQPQIKSKVGEDFEKVILNQARAMQPATAPPPKPTYGEIRDPRPLTAVTQQPTASNQAPHNLPTDQQKNQEKIQEKPGVIHDYKPGADPYREPIE